ncbi:hypothetical protein [Salininema proteolyticum]|uniref:Secreted protein n=1 Tax=Salininema proteolyticum TaxID=1607685 RepID=A0ABV8TX97_9ACTN
MRKVLSTAAVAAAGLATVGAAPALALGNSGVDAGEVSLVNVDASSAAHWQICGVNAFTTSYGQNCDNRDHFGEGPQSGVDSGDVSAVNVDVSDAAHWQICGINVATSPSLDQNCDSRDHFTMDEGGNGPGDKPLTGPAFQAAADGGNAMVSDMGDVQ